MQFIKASSYCDFLCLAKSSLSFADQVKILSLAQKGDKLSIRLVIFSFLIEIQGV